MARPARKNPYHSLFDEFAWARPRRPVSVADVFTRPSGAANYIMVIQGRCGSTWLGNVMQASKRLGVPNEWFNTPGMRGYVKRFEAATLRDYFTAISQRSTPFAMQIDAPRLAFLESHVDFKTSFIDTGFQWIDLRRRNLLAQAVSFVRAAVTGHWHGPGQPQVDLDDAQIWHRLALTVRHEQEIDRWYQQMGVVPLRLTYEDLRDSLPFALTRIESHVLDDDAPRIDFAPDSQIEKMTRTVDTQVKAFYRRHADVYEQVLDQRRTISAQEILRLSRQGR